MLAFAIQWAAFVPAYVRQTEHFFDLTGSATYLGMLAVALLLQGTPDTRSLLIAGAVTIWASRLGLFLFTRVRKDGFDRRFTAAKPHLTRFLMYWTLQGLWVFLTLGAGLAAMTSGNRVPIGWIGAGGVLLWVAGFAIETLADRQKRLFRADPANRDRFIHHGLWAWSRHPNYFGEVVLWVGIALIAAPAMSGWQRLTLISPIFVYLLLTRISGIPLLEAHADRKWAEDRDYERYKQSTPLLILRPPRPS
jgi:steroid 5-alpha reductase family enzyme